MHPQQTSSSLRMDPMAMLLEARRKLAANNEMRGFNTRQEVGEGLDHPDSRYMRPSVDERGQGSHDDFAMAGADCERGSNSRDSAAAHRQKRPILARRDTQSAAIREVEAMRRSLAGSEEFSMPPRPPQAYSDPSVGNSHSAALRFLESAKESSMMDPERSSDPQQKLFEREPSAREDLELQRRLAARRDQELEMRILQAQGRDLPRGGLESRQDRDTRQRLGGQQQQERDLQRRLSTEMEQDLQQRLNEAQRQLELQRRLSAQLENDLKRQFGSIREQERQLQRNCQNVDRDWDAQNRLSVRLEQEASQRVGGAASTRQELQRRQHRPLPEDETFWPPGDSEQDAQRRISDYMALTESRQPTSAMRAPELDQLLDDETRPVHRARSVSRQRELERLLDLERQAALGSTRAAPMQQRRQDAAWRDPPPRDVFDRYSRASDSTVMEQDILERDLARLSHVSRRRGSSRYSHSRDREPEQRKPLAPDQEMLAQRLPQSSSRATSSRRAQRDLSDQRAYKSAERRAHDFEELRQKRPASMSRRSSRQLPQELRTRSGDEQMSRPSGRRQASRRNSNHFEQQETSGEARHSRELLEEADRLRLQREAADHQAKRRHHHSERRDVHHRYPSVTRRSEERDQRHFDSRRRLWHGSRRDSAHLMSTSNDQAHAGSLAELARQHQPEKERRSHVRSSASSFKSVRNAMEIDADLTSSSDEEWDAEEEEEEDHRPAKGKVRRRLKSRAEDSSDALKSSETDASPDTDDNDRDQRPSYGKGTARSGVGRNEVSSMPDSSDDDTLKMPGRRESKGDNRSSKRRPSDVNARRSFEPQQPGSEGPDASRGRGSRKINAEAPLHDGRRRDSQVSRHSRKKADTPPVTASVSDDDDTLKGIGMDSDDTVTDHGRLPRRRESSAPKAAGRDARRRSSGGNVGSRFQDTGDASKTYPDETSSEQQRRASWRSKHNRATADSTQESEQRAPLDSRDTETGHSDEPPRKPDANKVQLLDRSKMMKAAASNKDGKSGDANNLSLVAKMALLKTVNRVPATEHAPTQVKPEDQLSEEDIEACKTRAQQKNDERRKRKAPPAAPATEQSEQMNSGPSDEEDEDVAPLLQKEAGRSEPAPAPKQQEEPQEEPEVAPLPAQEDTVAEEPAPMAAPPSDGDQDVMALEQKRRISTASSGSAKRQKPAPAPPPPPREKPLPTRPPPPPPQQPSRARPAPAEAARAPIAPPPPPQQQPQKPRKKSRPRMASATPAQALVVCCPCPPPPPASCCRRCGVACCYGGCCVRPRPC